MFIKTTENFTCAHCGEKVSGNGYTNHCPECLWSKHVDIEPGDRAAECGGLMWPVEWRERRGEPAVLQRCERCGHERWNKLTKNDKIEVFLK